MTEVNTEEIIQHFFTLLKEMETKQASDLYYTAGYQPSFRIRDEIVLAKGRLVDVVAINAIVEHVLNSSQKKEFHDNLELNFPITLKDGSRFRANLFRQQNKSGLVIRRINTYIPSLEDLGLPKIYGDVVMQKQGLVVLASPSGSGKSTSMAAMLGHRNSFGKGHILTVEDPIEFLHVDGNCIFTQREVGVDTLSYENALNNALRQKADVIVVGEVRTREAMVQALRFAESGHLCITTLHASSAVQAIKRMLSFFPEDMKQHAYLSLAQNLVAVFSQKLLTTVDDKRVIAIEILRNQGLVRNHIADGKIGEIADVVERTSDTGARTMDQALFDLYREGQISQETALHEAQNPSNLRLKMTKKLEGITQAESDDQF